MSQSIAAQSIRFRIRRSVALFLFKVAVVSVVTVVGAHYVVAGVGVARSWCALQYARVVDSVTRTKVVREYIKPEQLPLRSLVPKVAHDVGVPAVALQAIVERESSGARLLYRFEPKKFDELKRSRQYAKVSDDELRMLASSHGSAHVLGVNAEPRCGIHWSRLYDSVGGLECGARILRENLDRYKNHPNPSQRLWFALRDYNGSGAAAEAYADAVMARVGALLFDSLKETL